MASTAMARPPVAFFLLELTQPDAVKLKGTWGECGLPRQLRSAPYSDRPTVAKPATPSNFLR
jgi:hypothetical protein